eukprot:gene7389-15086_t
MDYTDTERFIPIQPFEIVDEGAPCSWKDNVFGCLNNIPSCLHAEICPCVAVAQLAENLDEEGDPKVREYFTLRSLGIAELGSFNNWGPFKTITSVYLILWLVAVIFGIQILYVSLGMALTSITFLLRTTMRERYNIPGNFMSHALSLKWRDIDLDTLPHAKVCNSLRTVFPEELFQYNSTNKLNCLYFYAIHLSKHAYEKYFRTFLVLLIIKSLLAKNVSGCFNSNMIGVFRKNHNGPNKQRKSHNTLTCRGILFSHIDVYFALMNPFNWDADDKYPMELLLKSLDNYHSVVIVALTAKC